jgi:hypothetical protein
MTQDKILDRLAKMKALQEGEAAIGNVAAAESFAAMINAMLLRHELSVEDIPLRAEDDPIIEQVIDPTAYGLKFSRTRIGWQEVLAAIVADAHLCKLLVHQGSNFVTFIGTKSHVAVAEHAYGVLVSAADRMSMAARNEWWRTECGGRHLASGNYRASWLRGFIVRINERLTESRRREVEQAACSTSTALIRIDQALTRAQQYVDERYKRKAAAVRIGHGNRQAERDGRAAADAMKIGQRGVGAAERKRLA